MLHHSHHRYDVPDISAILTLKAFAERFSTTVGKLGQDIPRYLVKWIASYPLSAFTDIEKSYTHYVFSIPFPHFHNNLNIDSQNTFKIHSLEIHSDL